MSKVDELGTLIVVVLKAKDLNDKHSFYKQDAYAQITFNGVTKKTQVDIKGGQHPVWDAEFRFPVMKDSSQKFRQIDVSCWAKEHKTDDPLGQGKVDIADTLRTGEFDDWVKLDLNGVARGEMYLEITYYSNAPVPAPTTSSLAVPVTANLARRPSKLKPADRLWRPPQPQTPPTSQSSTPHAQRIDQGFMAATPPKESRLYPPSNSSSRSSSADRRDNEAALPPLPEDGVAVPNILKPGAGVKPQHALPMQANAVSKPVPSMLRPGNANTSTKPLNIAAQQRVPNPARHPSGSPPRAQSAQPPQGVYGYTPTPAPGPYNYQSSPPASNTRFPGNSTYVPQSPTYKPPNPTYAPQNPAYAPPNPTYASHPDPTPTGPVSFPVPSVSTPPQGAYPPNNSSAFYGPDHPHHHQRTTSWTQPSYTPQPPQPNVRHNSNDLPDPYLMARYQTPLPLPPGSESPPRGRRDVSPPPQHPARQEPVPVARHSPPILPRRHSPPISQQKHSPPPPKKTQEDTARIEALRRAENELKRRKEQEEKDLELARDLDRQRNEQEEKDMELARQLDRQLNLEEAAREARSGDRRTSDAPMPGRW